MAKTKKRKLNSVSSRQNQDISQVNPEAHGAPRAPPGDALVQHEPHRCRSVDSAYSHINRLPIELIDHIFSYLITSPDSLRACAFVRRAWFPLIQRIFLSSRVDITVPSSSGYDLSFEPRSDYLLLVRKAGIYIWDEIWRDSLADATNNGANYLVHLSAKFRALEELRVSGSIYGWHIFPPAHPFRLVKLLVLDFIELNVQAFFNFLTSFPFLETLSLRGFIWDDSSPSVYEPQTAPSQSISSNLKTLILGGRTLGNQFSTSNALIGLLELLGMPGFPSLYNLRFEPEHSRCEIGEIAGTLGASLRQLQICWVRFPYALLFNLPRSTSLIRMDIYGIIMLDQLTDAFKYIAKIVGNLPNPQAFQELRLSMIGVDPRYMDLLDLKGLDSVLSEEKFANFRLLRIRYSVSSGFKARAPRPGIKFAFWKGFPKSQERGVLQIAFDKASDQPEPFSEF